MHIKHRAHRFWAWGPPVAHASFLFWLSSQSSLPGTPGGDKVAHGTAYTILGFLLARAFTLTTALPAWGWLIATWTLGTLYGISDEFHQSFVPGRDSSAGDAFADACGVLLGALLWLAVLKVMWTKLGRSTGVRDNAW